MRFTHLLGLASLSLVVAACGDDGGSTPVDAADLVNPGFPVPTAVTKANMKVNGAWTELGDANWTCHGTPSADQPSTMNIDLSGKLVDFQVMMNGVGAATITAFAGVEITGNLGQATTDNTDQNKGNYTMTVTQLPSGQTRYGFKFEAAGYVKTYLLNQYIDPTQATATRNMAAISEQTATVIPALLGINRDTTKGVLAGAMRDCDGHEVSNAVATVSSTKGTTAHLTGAKTFYFSAGSTSLPVRHNAAPVMNKDGLFTILDLPPQGTPAYMQVWGFRTPAELASGQMTLLAELPAPVEANAVITASIEVLRQ